LATSLLRHTTSNFFQLNTYFHSSYVTSSLRRGWVCSIRLLLGLASAVILTSYSRGTRAHIFLSQIPGGPGPRIYISASFGWCARYIISWHGPRRKHHFQHFIYCCGNLFLCEGLSQ
jgi:hypothetical protein